MPDGEGEALASPEGLRQVEAEGNLGFERVVFFSDAVFAIAVTLLAIDIRMPELPPAQTLEDLPGAVLDLVPEFLVYALSFTIIAGLWMEHHRIFSFIQRYDYRLIWHNLLLLLCVAFLPVPDSALSRFPGEEATVLFYATALFVTGLAQLGLWRYASAGRRLIDRHADPAQVRYVTLRGAIPTATAALAAVVAPFAPQVAMAVLVGLFVAAVVLGRVYFEVLRRLSGARF